MALPSGLPPQGIPLTDAGGQVSDQWYQFFASLFYRTGATAGQALSQAPTQAGQVFQAGAPPNIGWGLLTGQSFGDVQENTFFAGPLNGADEPPAFRQLAGADLAVLDGQYPGTTDGVQANAGDIGEVIFSNVDSGSPIALSTGVASDITSINLGIGDWDLWGNIGLTAAINGTTAAWINTVSATDPTAPNNGAYLFLRPQAGGGVVYPVGMMSLLLNAPATLYLSANATFSGSVNAYGFLGNSPPEIKRTFNASEVDAILNDPSIFPAIALPTTAKFETAKLLSNLLNVAFVCEGGCLLFAYKEPGIYEVHIGFLEGYRGAYAKQAFLIASRLMFMTTSALTLMIRIPDTNRAARVFYASVGAKQEFHREAAWPTVEGNVGQSYWAIRYDNWILSNAEMIKIGVDFTIQLNDARSLAGHEPEIFDPTSYPYLGAFMLMACAGQLDKAVILFNRFALFAELGPCGIVSHNPAVIDTGSTLIQFVDNEFKVLLCR